MRIAAGSQGDIQVQQVRAGIVVGPAVDEITDKILRCLFLQGFVQIAGSGEGGFLNAEALEQRSEVRVEWRFDKGVQALHAAVGKGKDGRILINSLGAHQPVRHPATDKTSAYADTGYTFDIHVGEAGANVRSSRM